MNLTQRSVIGTIPTGAQPGEMLILPNNRTAFVSNPADNSISLLDLETRTSGQLEQVGDTPGSMIASPDGRYVYVALEGSNYVAVFLEWNMDGGYGDTYIPVGTTPVMLNLSPNGRYLYSVNRDSDSVSVVDTNRFEVVKELSVGQQPVQIAISPNLHTAYVVNSGSNNLSVVDLDSNEVTGTIAVGQGPASVAYSTDGQFLYVINRNSNNISVVDTTQSRVISQIPVGSQPTDMVLTFDSHYGFVGNQGSNNVTLLDLFTRTAELNIPVGVQPFDLALDPNEDFLYVTNLGSQSLTVIDVNLDRAVATIPIGGVPVQFTQYNAPTLLELAPNPAPAGSTLTLNGDSLLPSSTVQFVSTAPPRTVTVQPTWLDSQGLQVTVPSMQGSSAVVSVNHPDGNSSEQLTLRFGSSTAAVSAGGVVEGAGFQAGPYPISGATIVSVFGSFSGVTQAQASAFPLPTSLGNARVTFNGYPAPLLFSSTGQINLVSPVRLFALDSVRVAVTAGNQTSRVETVHVAPFSPGIFQIPGTGRGTIAHGNRPRDLVTPSDPSQRGETLILYATGLGDAWPYGPLDGEPTPFNIPPSTGPDGLRVNGVLAQVIFGGFAPGFSGLWQVNFVVPAATPVGDNVPVVYAIDTLTSNTAILSVR